MARHAHMLAFSRRARMRAAEKSMMAGLGRLRLRAMPAFRAVDMLICDMANFGHTSAAHVDDSLARQSCRQR